MAFEKNEKETGKMKKKVLAMVLVMGMAAGVLTGCGTAKDVSADNGSMVLWITAGKAL